MSNILRGVEDTESQTSKKIAGRQETSNRAQSKTGTVCNIKESNTDGPKNLFLFIILIQNLVQYVTNSKNI